MSETWDTNSKKTAVRLNDLVSSRADLISCTHFIHITFTLDKENVNQELHFTLFISHFPVIKTSNQENL